VQAAKAAFRTRKPSAFRLARTLRCRLSRLRLHTVKALIGGAAIKKGIVWD